MNNKLKLIIILNDAPFFISHRLPLAIEAKRQGFEVHVLAPFHKKSSSTIIRSGLNFHNIPLKRGSTNPISELKLIISIWKKIYEIKPHLVHLVSMKPVLYGGAIARLLKVPGSINAITGLGYLFVSSSLMTNILKKLIFKIYSFSLNHKNSISIFQNDDDLELFLNRNLVEISKTMLIKGCGVDINQFKPSNRIINKKIIMFPARIIGDKGANEFFQAAIKFKEEKIPARFVLVGRLDPDNPTNIDKKVISDLVSKNIVEWWGFSEKMNETLLKASIICLPSYREGLPKVLIEAAALAKPIVTSDVPGCREIVIDRFNGILVPAKDSIKLFLSLKELIENQELQRIMGEKGRKMVEENFTLKNFISNSMHAYKKVITKTNLNLEYSDINS